MLIKCKKSSIFKYFFHLKLDEKPQKPNTVKISKNVLEVVALISISSRYNIFKTKLLLIFAGFVEQIQTRAFALSRTKQILNA